MVGVVLGPQLDAEQSWPKSVNHPTGTNCSRALERVRGMGRHRGGRKRVTAMNRKRTVAGAPADGEVAPKSDNLWTALSGRVYAIIQ